MLDAQRTLAVQRLAGAIDDPAEQAFTDAHARGTRQWQHARIRGDAARRAYRHEIQAIGLEADHLGLQRRHAVLAFHQAAAAERSPAAFRFQRETGNAPQAAFDRRRRRFEHALARGGKARPPDGIAISEWQRVAAHASCPRVSPSAASRRLPMRASSVAFTEEVAVSTRQPPRDMEASSITRQERSMSSSVIISRNSAASSGCRYTRSRSAPEATRSTARRTQSAMIPGLTLSSCCTICMAT